MGGGRFWKGGAGAGGRGGERGQGERPRGVASLSYLG